MSAKVDLSIYQINDVSLKIDKNAPARIDIRFQLPDIAELRLNDRRGRIRRAVYECIKKYMRTTLNETTTLNTLNTLNTNTNNTKNNTTNTNNPTNNNVNDQNSVRSDDPETLASAIEAFLEKEISVDIEKRDIKGVTSKAASSSSASSSKGKMKGWPNDHQSRILVHITISCLDIYRHYYIDAWKECIKQKKFSKRLCRKFDMDYKKDSHKVLLSALKVTYTNTNAVDRDIDSIEMIPFSKSTSGSWAQYQNYLKRKQMSSDFEKKENLEKLKERIQKQSLSVDVGSDKYKDEGVQQLIVSGGKGGMGGKGALSANSMESQRSDDSKQNDNHSLDKLALGNSNGFYQKLEEIVSNRKDNSNEYWLLALINIDNVNKLENSDHVISCLEFEITKFCNNNNSSNETDNTELKNSNDSNDINTYMDTIDENESKIEENASNTSNNIELIGFKDDSNGVNDRFAILLNIKNVSSNDSSNDSTNESDSKEKDKEKDKYFVICENNLSELIKEISSSNNDENEEEEKYTISIGISSLLMNDDKDNLLNWRKRALNNLKIAKQNGGNQYYWDKSEKNQT